MNKQLRKTRRGFTITEILIAVLLVLILSAIAVPRLLGNQRQAEDTNAKAQLRTSAEVARNLMYEGGGRFTTAISPQMMADEPNIKFVDYGADSAIDANGRTRSVSVGPETTKPTIWWAAALGGLDNGQYNCWYVKLDATGKDQFGLKKMTTASGCSASANTTLTPADIADYDFPNP